jgi:DNA-binding LytR/AlgR family response regulator
VQLLNKIAVCDDEKMQINILKKTIRESGLFEAGNTEIHSFERGVSLIKAVQKGVIYDYIFLDINMPEKDGFQTYEELKITENTKVVFVSSHYKKLPEVTVLRNPQFLFKPYDVDTFSRTVQAINTLQKREYIFTYIEDGIENTISSKEIRYIHVMNHDILATTDESTPVRLERKSLETIADILKPYGFFRCHRSYLINFDYYKKHDSTQLYLFDGVKEFLIPLSRKKKNIVAGAFFKYKMRGETYGN